MATIVYLLATIVYLPLDHGYKLPAGGAKVTYVIISTGFQVCQEKVKTLLTKNMMKVHKEKL